MEKNSSLFYYNIGSCFKYYSLHYKIFFIMKKDKPKFYLTLSTMGLEMGLSIVVGFFLGKFLDEKLQIAPWGSIIGIFLGLVAAFRSVYQKIRKLQQWIISNRIKLEALLVLFVKFVIVYNPKLSFLIDNDEESLYSKEKRD